MKKLKCPHCGSPFVESEDCIDSQYNEDSMTRICVGFCMDCYTPLTWKETFQFTQYSDIKISD